MEVAAFRRFGDDDGDSRLMDRYERMSFEIQLHKAIHFGRSLSHPNHMPTTTTTTTISSFSTYSNISNHAPPPFTTTTEDDRARQGRRIRMMSRGTSRHGLGGGFNRVFKRLLKPILWRKKSTATDDHILHAAQQPQLPNQNLTSWKKFSRSLRV